jgi:hypothetical protein
MGEVLSTRRFLFDLNRDCIAGTSAEGADEPVGVTSEVLFTGHP